jgi:ribonuclease D
MNSHPPKSQPDPAHAENLIQDGDALAKVSARCRECEAVAVDTEFVWTRTYYPRLGLIQLAVSPEEAWLVDTVALTDLSPMAAMLTDGSTVKVFHDPEMDLPILVRAVGCQPVNVFDTRLAAGFAGLAGTLSLARLIQEFFGIELPKTQTRTDWCKRPLTPHQLAYALDDVRYMPRLRELLLERVRERGNEAWLQEEMDRYNQPEQVAPADPDEMFRTVKGMGRLSGVLLAILQKLVAWRELAARRMDLPRKRVLSDEACLELAKRQPKDGQAVVNLKCVARRTARECADEVAAAIAEGAAVPKKDWPRFRSSPLPQKVLKAHADAILNAVRRTAESRSVDPAIVTSRKDVNGLVLDQASGKLDGHPLRTGWRGELLNDVLDPLLRAVPVRG